MTSKEKQIPSILIIDVKTRIPDHYTIKYKPSMTIPDQKSKYVLFDPLVVYNLDVVNGGRIEELFEKDKFETMINRTFGYFGMQPKRKKIEDNILKNNVQITLKKLFGSGNLFYIDNQPYTIISHRWDGKWNIETIPEFEKVQFGGQDEKIYYYPYPSSIQKYVFNITRKGAVRITVELSLFEGENPSTTDKLNVNCETQFENIRRSYAELMGYEYRPMVSKSKTKGGKKKKKSKKVSKTIKRIKKGLITDYNK